MDGTEAIFRSILNNRRIIVGVDYGTTYTGISYVPSTKNNISDINVVRTWPGPGKEGDAVWKTPSRIAYSTENKDLKANAFGYEVMPKMKSYSWTKLLLDGSTPSTEYDDPHLRKSEGDGMLKIPYYKTATDVATDYLREVYKHTIKQLEKNISPEVLRITPLEFWFTVPAIWSDKAKAATQSAAKAAGFASRQGDKIYMIPEPEAAAVSTLSSLIEDGSTIQIKEGDGVLVCDCGGGTVDITTYKILNTSPGLRFEELIEGAGGKCGSTYIDRLFHMWMSKKFGAAFDNVKFEKKGPGSRFMKDFEGHKKDFGTKQDLDHVYEIELVMNADSSGYYDDDESLVRLKGRDMLSFFNPVVEKITAMLEEQIRLANKVAQSSKINRVILVGGFGDSPYLNDQLRRWCTKQQIRLICPEHPQAAIVRGAALRGLEGTAPISKRCRRHYGFTIGRPFQNGVDPDSDSYYDRWSQQKMCRGIMEWQIKKGQQISEGTFVSKDVRMVHEEGENLTYCTKLFSSTFENAPERVTDPGVEYVGTLVHSFNRDDLDNFENKRSWPDQKLIWDLQYAMQVLPGSKEGVLLFRVMCDGRELGSSTIEFPKD